MFEYFFTLAIKKSVFSFLTIFSTLVVPLHSKIGTIVTPTFALVPGSPSIIYIVKNCGLRNINKTYISKVCSSHKIIVNPQKGLNANNLANNSFNNAAHDSGISNMEGALNNSRPDKNVKTFLNNQNPSSLPGKVIKGVSDLAESTPVVKDIVKFVKNDKKEGFVFGVSKDEGLLAYEDDRKNSNSKSKNQKDTNSGDIGNTDVLKKGQKKSSLGVTYKIKW